ncbi:hypothetical protein H4W79_002090 [Nocardiopsis terrae]|uniref:Uncharacterized protein n=1 Tax=Nocardiopsis terrae TaxID=372655 RepID=A0ABR9HFS4_9ACTN|nr:hypothetical protein [Nocardiopsis terrae]
MKFQFIPQKKWDSPPEQESGLFRPEVFGPRPRGGGGG